jgi:hypothetical protein
MNEPIKTSLAQQASFLGLCPVTAAVDLMAAASIDGRGAVFTRPEVVHFILDLVRYTSDAPLHKRRLLEPSIGQGDFLLPAVDRLIASWRTHAPNTPASSLTDCLRAVELHEDSLETTRQRLISRLREHGVSAATARGLAESWLVRGDFLLTPFEVGFDYVVGNPPYVRQELIPDALMAEYRARYRTVYDRADIYIPFIERSLTLLGEGGALGFICADRWMKNRYGGPLRQMVAEGFHLKVYVDMYDTPAFQSDVIAYPAITVMTRERPGPTRITRRPAIEDTTLNKLAASLLDPQAPDPSGMVQEMADVATGAQPWILESHDQIALVRRLERDFPAIEDTGCKIGIGVATGADKAFIGPFEELDVEPDRKLPLVMTRDILSGQVAWRGLGVINPFADQGGLVDLRQYPRLRRTLEARKEVIERRHVAQKSPENWFRTIDRIDPDLARKPKLLIPDIKGEAHIVYEEGRLYPHHNLYYITSDVWDLRALQAVLTSGIARLFVATYSTRMRGGYLRFQAQYLRRIRLPRWQDVSPTLKAALIKAAECNDMAACNQATWALYGLSPEERAAIGDND